MTESLTVSTRSLFLSSSAEAAEPIDIEIDGHHIWSTQLPPEKRRPARIAWPRTLRPYLDGVGTISVKRSSDGELLASAEVSLGRKRSPITVTDASGRWLTLNKWSRLTAPVGSDPGGMRIRLLRETKTLLGRLQHLGYTAYITGGTLLGAVRDGEMLPHDDDTDLGILLEHSAAADLALESFNLEAALTASGYRIVRHSIAHLQLVFSDDAGGTDFYIDIFSAFYRSEHEFCQPFHVRADVPRTAMVPLSEVPLAGDVYPAPHIPGTWLEACYGTDWRVPDSSFAFDTPESTKRRFDSWFGAYDTFRLFWQDHYGALTEAHVDPSRQHQNILARHLPAGVPVLELGCGVSSLPRTLARHGHPVTAVDYSDKALSIASKTPADAVSWRETNLNDRRQVLNLAADLLDHSEAWHISLDRVIAGLAKDGRSNVLLLARLMLGEGAFATMTFDTTAPASRHSWADPTTWCLTVEELSAEAGAFGLSTHVVGRGHRWTRWERRNVVTVVLRRSGKDS